MSVEQQAYRECWQWLDSDRVGPCPEPPAGMHQLAVNEWWRGYRAAVAEFQVEEAKIDVWTDIIMWGIKALIFGAFLVWVYASNDPGIRIAGGLTGLLILWRSR